MSYLSLSAWILPIIPVGSTKRPRTCLNGSVPYHLCKIHLLWEIIHVSRKPDFFFSSSHEICKFNLKFFWCKFLLALIQQLFERDPTRRLGIVGNIRLHPFFKTINWQALERREVDPPFKPKVVRAAHQTGV